MLRQTLVILIVIVLNVFSIIHSQHLPLCDSLNEIEGNENDKKNSDVKSRRIRALCDVIYSRRVRSDHDELNLIPDFDLTKIDSGKITKKIYS
jgi:hypothetical protein